MFFFHPLDWLYDSLSSPPVAGVWWAHWRRCTVAAVASSKWMLHTGGGWGETPHMIVKSFGCMAIHSKALYKCIIHSFIPCYHSLLFFHFSWGVWTDTVKIMCVCVCVCVCVCIWECGRRTHAGHVVQILWIRRQFTDVYFMTFCLFQAEPQWLWISSLAFYPGQRSDHTRKWWLLGSVVVFVDKSCCNAIDCDGQYDVFKIV